MVDVNALGWASTNETGNLSQVATVSDEPVCLFTARITSVVRATINNGGFGILSLDSQSVLFLGLIDGRIV